MVDKSRLLAIKALDFTPKYDKQFEAYMLELFFFCDTLPSHEAGIKATLEAKDYDTFLSLLETLRGFLVNIRATSLADACKKHEEEFWKSIKSGIPVDHEKLQADIDALFAELDALSIDILVAGFIQEYTLPEPHEGLPVKSSADEPAGKAANILAVDDAKFYLLMLKSYFKDTQYQLNCVDSSGIALRILGEAGGFRPDLFILDIDMPGMNGYELAQAIRKTGLSAPIIFLTNTATKDTVLQALESGGSDLIIKSSSKEQILERVEKYL